MKRPEDTTDATSWQAHLLDASRAQDNKAGARDVPWSEDFLEQELACLRYEIDMPVRRAMVSGLRHTLARMLAAAALAVEDKAALQHGLQLTSDQP